MPKKASMSKSKVKFMFVHFFDSMNIVYKQWVRAEQATNQYYYTQIHKRFKKRVLQFRPNIAINWILHHDNAPAHAALSDSAVRDAAASVLTWSRTLRLLSISKGKIGSERTPFWVNRRHLEGCNTGLKRHPTNCIPGMLQRMAAPLEKVCTGTRDLLWRWPHCSWWINKIKVFWYQSRYFIVRPHSWVATVHS